MHWGCRKKPTNPVEVNTEDYHPLRSIAEPLPMSDMGQGDLIDGVYTDSTGLFAVPVLEDWTAESGSPFGELRLTLSHAIHDYSIEIWQIKGTHYRPAVREDCVWSFVDKGLYTDWSMSRPTSVATCISDDPDAGLIFLYFKHWKGNTWYLEGHVALDVLVEGERTTREIIQSITWLDGE